LEIPRSENRAVMLTDMKGFTAATSRQTREENARMLALHDALLLPVVQAFGGRCLKRIGDALLVLFAAPTEALLCAMAIQDRLWDHARRVPEAQRIEVRIAISLGEVRLAHEGGVDDVYGEAVNLAARVEEQAEPGEIWFTEAVYWVADRSLVPLEELGFRDLRGLPEKVRLFRVPRSGQAGTPPHGGAGLAFVAGLEEPSPERLARRTARRRPLLRRLSLALAGAALLGAAGLALHRFLPRAVPPPPAPVNAAAAPAPARAEPAPLAEPTPAASPTAPPALEPKAEPKAGPKAKPKPKPKPARRQAARSPVTR